MASFEKDYTWMHGQQNIKFPHRCKSKWFVCCTKKRFCRLRLDGNIETTEITCVMSVTEFIVVQTSRKHRNKENSWPPGATVIIPRAIYFHYELCMWFNFRVSFVSAVSGNENHWRTPNWMVQPILQRVARRLSSTLLNDEFQVMIYRVSQEECARLPESVPYVKLYRYNPKHLCPK